MALQPRIPIQARVTKTANFTPTGAGVDISTLDPDSSLSIEVYSLVNSTGQPAALTAVFEQSVDGFTTVIPTGASFNFHGVGVSWRITWRTYRDLPSLRLGVAGATLRLKIVDMTTNTTVDYAAWIK